MGLLNNITCSVLVFMCLVLNEASSNALKYTIEPQYLSLGDSLQHFCEFQDIGNAVIAKESTPCIYNCAKVNDGCQLYRPGVSIDCNEDHIKINITQAHESDFGVWRCAVTETISILVQEYG